MRKGERKVRELAERLAELGAHLDELRARAHPGGELNELSRCHDALSAGMEALQEKTGADWFDVHERLADETAKLTRRIEALREGSS